MIEAHKIVNKSITKSDITNEEASSDADSSDGVINLDSDNTVQNETAAVQEAEENVIYPLKPSDFIIAEDLEDVDNFQEAIKSGVYYFATREKNSETGEMVFKTQSWDVLGNGAIREEYDKADDAQAEAEFKTYQSKVQTIDKKLELELNKLESERDAIQTEIDSITKVIDDNIDSSFKTFS